MYTRTVIETLELSESPDQSQTQTFVGSSVRTGTASTFGGQLLGQSVTAASRTVDVGRRFHSLHAYFLLPGDIDQPVEYEVVRLRDGRSFSSRQVHGKQGGRMIYAATLSFQMPQSGKEHEYVFSVTDVPRPDGLPTRFPQSQDSAPFAEELLDIRMIPPSLWKNSEPGQLAAWVKLREKFTEAETLQRAALAFMSDAIVQDPALLEHGLEWETPGVSLASLDHAFWCHRTPDVSEWMLFVQESPNGRDGRGMVTGRIYSQGGAIIATVGQEMLLREHQ